MTAALGSVVVAAHQEAAVIDRLLDALLAGVPAGALEVVVACNGCTDDTAARARAHGVVVLDLPVASKRGALSAGDAAATAFPRLYLDADVVLPGASALAVLEQLRRGPHVAARPPLRYAADGASAVVQRYYRARSANPHLMSALWGAGAYALSEAGRRRFGDWPDVVADDLFVHGLFSPDEIAVVACAPVMVGVPQHATALVHVLRRTYRGKAELPVSGPGPTRRRTLGASAAGLLRTSLRSPGAGIDALVYAGFAVGARLLPRRGPAPAWERDDTSRAAA